METDQTRVYRKLAERSEETLTRAMMFYDRSPDGQYDEIAALAIQFILLERQRVQRIVNRGTRGSE